MIDLEKITIAKLASREEKIIIRDAEKVRSGEEAEAEERARDLEDGVDFAVAPEDVETEESAGNPDSTAEVDFEDQETTEDHGRGLV